MSIAARAFLLLSALLCAGFVGLAGIGFALMAEPYKTDAWTFVFWTLVALVVASPLWLPATIPDHHPKLLRIVRWISALALLLPTTVFANMLREQLQHGLIYMLTTWQPIMLASIALTSACVIAWWLLVAPDVSTLLRRRALHSG
jgi:hypothetical protein